MISSTKEILVGIDFGTTNTVITYFENNKSEILMDGIFKMIPSKIGLYEGKKYCGNYIPINSEKVYHSFKRLIGEDNKEVFNLLIVFFSHLRDLIIRKFNSNLITSVITVPSNFSDNQREIIRGAFESVNIKVLRIINEPSAAALAYGLSQSSNENEKILVIDTGGGTMDFTILEKSDTLFEVIHSEGLNDLGGNNFTELIYNDIIKTKNINNMNEDNIIWNTSQRIKERLTYLDYVEVTIKCEKEIKYNITRNKFNNLSSNILERVKKTLDNLKEYEVNYIILVGGTSRIPILKETIEKYLKKTVWIHPNLETVVAEGAGLYTGIIKNQYTKNNDVILMDVLPLSLGVELADGTFSVIIPKNTPLPMKSSQKYTIDTPGETSIKVKVYQGERKIANKNILIGEFSFDKVSMSAMPIIEIIFKVDLNSIINVTIIDKKSGIEKTIIIKDIPKIEMNELEELIESSNKLNEIDEIDLQMSQNRYLIRSNIENILINLQENELINIDDKNEIIKHLNEIEDKIDTLNQLQLIDTLNIIQEKYTILTKNKVESVNLNNNIDELEKMIINDKKNELKNKIEILLINNPEWDEYLNPVLDELTYDNITIQYIYEKLELIDELQNNNENVSKDYKQEVNNLCLYLKNEMENGNINLHSKNHLLIDLINNTLILLNNSSDIDWKNQLDLLNLKCQEIYNL
jgi:molecular chaperone DnaK